MQLRGKGTGYYLGEQQGACAHLNKSFFMLCIFPTGSGSDMSTDQEAEVGARGRQTIRIGRRTQPCVRLC